MPKICPPAARERSAADKRADKGIREGSKRDVRADAKPARERVPQRDGLAKMGREMRKGMI